MTSGHWTDLAARWDAIGPPLRPSAADVDIVVQLAAALPPHRRRCMVLGATRELATAPWPAGTEVCAVDRSAAMLDALWDPGASGDQPDDGGIRRVAVLGDWRAIPVAEASVDLAICDGGWHLLDQNTGQGELAGELARTVRPGGAVAVRVFAPSHTSLDVATTLDLLHAGGIEDANHLKVLLWMALRDEQGTVAVADVWDALHCAHPDLTELAADLGWPPATLQAFEAYRSSADRYHLIDDHAVARRMESTGAFRFEGTHEAERLTPDLRFPTVVLRRLG